MAIMTLTTAGPKKSPSDGAEGEMSTNEKQTAEEVRELLDAWTAIEEDVRRQYPGADAWLVYRIASARMNLALGLGPLADLA